MFKIKLVNRYFCLKKRHVNKNAYSIQTTVIQFTKATKSMAAAVLTPAASLRLNPFSVTVRFLSLRRTTPLLPLLSQPTTLLTKNPHFPPKKCTHYYVNSPFSGGRKLSGLISAALPSGEAVEKQKAQVLGSDKVGKFRKRLKIVDIKGGPDEGLDRLGQTLVVKGWVRTLRAQSSVTFIEVLIGFRLVFVSILDNLILMIMSFLLNILYSIR